MRKCMWWVRVGWAIICFHNIMTGRNSGLEAGERGSARGQPAQRDRRAHEHTQVIVRWKNYWGSSICCFNSVKHLDIPNFSLKNFTVLAAHNGVIWSPQWHWYVQKKLLNLALYIHPSQTCTLCSVACQDWAVRSALVLITSISEEGIGRQL